MIKRDLDHDVDLRILPLLDSGNCTNFADNTVIDKFLGIF